MIIFLSILTIVTYICAKYLYKYYKKTWALPIITAPLLIVIWLALIHLPVSVYEKDTTWLLWWVGPSTVAFAVPVYIYKDLIRRHYIALILGIIAAIIAQLLSAAALIHWLHLPNDIARSFIVRSISTPFALTAGSKIGASPDLTALCLVLTGFTGMFIGGLIIQGLKFFRIHSRVAHGSSFGTSAHIIGTAKAMTIGQEEGTVASIAMIFSGIVMVMLAPLIAMFL